MIRRLVVDLGMDVEIVGHETVREPDGLAMSSRNVHLTPETRAQALALSRALAAAQRALDAGERSRAALEALVEQEIARAPLAKPDYPELRDAQTLAPAPEYLTAPTLLALAVLFPKAGGDAVRLIDNGTSSEMIALRQYLIDHGLYLYTHWHTVLVIPPLIITPEQLAEGFAVLDKAG